jgi:hypothetical protein
MHGVMVSSGPRYFESAISIDELAVFLVLMKINSCSREIITYITYIYVVLGHGRRSGQGRSSFGSNVLLDQWAPLVRKKWQALM